MEGKLPLIDGVKWYVFNATNGLRHAQALCPQHNMRLQSVIDYRVMGSTGRMRNNYERESKTLLCTDGNHNFKLPRALDDEQAHVINKVDAINFAQMPVINLDDSAVPVAKEELSDSDHWVLAKVTKSKAGDRLIIWAGDKSKKNKTQLFVEPGIKKLGFDQNDSHPTEVFAKVEVTFANDVKASITKEK